MKCSLLRVFAAACLLVRPALADSRPNIVFIYADDWGWGDLSCHGHPWLATPNLDRLAAEGTDFQQFNVLSPVCSPSRVAALTGRFPARYNINNVFSEGEGSAGMPDWLDPKAPTTARFLQAAGYRTAHFGKWHLCAEVPDAPALAQYGFDQSAVYHGPGPKIPLHEIGDYAARFIEANKNQPFYVDVWLHESHLAHDPTPASLEKWQQLDERRRVYAAVITDGDSAVGKVLDAIDRAGLKSNTLVVFSSDNGPESTGGPEQKGRPGKLGSYYSLGETGGLRGRKRSLFEGGVRLPFIVRWPGHAPAGLRDEKTVFSAVDLLPTFCAAAGVAPPAGTPGDGESLLAALEGRLMTRTRPIFWYYGGKRAEPDWWPRVAIREGDWKLVMTDDGKRVELHDVVKDRAEATDVAREHPDVVARLAKLGLEWKATLPTGPDPQCLSQAKPPATEDASNKKRRAPVEGTPDRSKAFLRWDTNHDGVITLEEYEAGLAGKPNLEARFKNFDKDGDGKLTREEYVGHEEPRRPADGQ